MTCKHCGSELPVRIPGSPGPGRRYCSASCRARACAERDPQRQARWDQTSRDRKRKPATRECVECGKTFDGTPRQTICSAQCRRRRRAMQIRVHNHRRRVSGTRITSWRAREVFERAGWTCYLCGQPTPPGAVWPAPDSATIDHVVPISRGGTNDSGNVRCCCWSCNSRKGARA